MLTNILAVGLMASVMSFSPRYVVDNQNDTITFSAEELNNNTYTYLASKIIQLNNDADTTLSNTTITYHEEFENTFTYVETDVETKVMYQDTSEDYSLQFILDEQSVDFGKWIYCYWNDAWVKQTLSYSLTINNAEWFIANIQEPPSLTLSKYDLNNNKYTYLAEQMVELQPVLGNTSITYNNNTYEYDDLAEGLLGYYYEQNETYIYFVYDTNESNYEVGKWIYWTSDEVNTPFAASITINNAQWYLDNINAPLDSGDMMTAITSGLPLMASLAQAFLNGFTSIFWNSTTSSLTTFSMFALIMLSVAIVFACIKLVLNVVRSNTGV